jgi:hydroxymethylglutaryl-CoA lyase
MQASFVTIEDQGLRDGLQSLPVTVPTAVKLRWAGMLAGAGLRRLQVASFVHPAKVPQMADAEEMVRGLSGLPGVVVSALVLNEKGVARAAATGIGHVAASLSASDTHGRRNTGMGLEAAMEAFRGMASTARAAGIRVRGGVQCAFGCRYEGAVAPERVAGLVMHLLDCGVEEVALADSTGMGHPRQVRELCEAVMEHCGEVPLSLHLHNTENKGYANLMAALEAGVRRFDTAFGGLGGCPFIKGATGNIATEDTVHLLHQSGWQTGIDMTAVAAVSREAEALLGNPLPGLLYGMLGRDDIRI